MTQRKKRDIMESQNTPENTRKLPDGMMPWKPGQSGNPGGRPAMSPEVKAALAGAALPAIQKQIELLGCGDVRVELMASQALLDRFYGKAVQAVEANVTTTNVQQAHLQILVELQAKRDQAMKTIEATDAVKAFEWGGAENPIEIEPET